MQQVGAAFGVAVVGILFFLALEQARSAGSTEAAAYAPAFFAASVVGAVGAATAAGLISMLPGAGAWFDDRAQNPTPANLACCSVEVSGNRDSCG